MESAVHREMLGILTPGQRQKLDKLRGQAAERLKEEMERMRERRDELRDELQDRLDGEVKL